MKSMDNHINHPMETRWIDPRSFNSTNEVHYITQERYDMMRSRNPEVVFVIIDSPEDRMYLGDYEIPKPAHSRQYLISFEDHRKVYKIYLNLISNYRDNLVPVAEYDNLEDAVKALHAYQSVGYHTKSAYNVYQSIANYIKKVYGINESIIGMIASFGYRDDPRLQYLNEEAIHYGVTNKDRDLPQYYRAALHNLKTVKPDAVIGMYSDIYDVFVKYNFFPGIDFDRDNDIDLSKPVNDIIACVNRYIFN